MQQHTDAELVAEILNGRVNAYSVLVRRYQDSYVRFATRMVGNRDDADDALQSAFVRAYRALRECRDPARFGAWLYQIVANECRTLVSRRARRERRIVRDDAAMEASAVDHENGYAAEIEEIQHALDKLESEQREAFVLKHVEQLTYEEMSALTSASVSALKMRVKRACDRLRQLLEHAGVRHES